MQGCEANTVGGIHIEAPFYKIPDDTPLVAVRSAVHKCRPGIAVAVALIPPIATIGIGIAKLNIPVIVGATVFLVVNIIGIVFASMLVFSLMNLYVKRTIASKVANLSDKEVEEKKEKIQEEKEKEEQKESQA